MSFDPHNPEIEALMQSKAEAQAEKMGNPFGSERPALGRRGNLELELTPEADAYLRELEGALRAIGALPEGYEMIWADV